MPAGFARPPGWSWTWGRWPRGYAVGASGGAAAGAGGDLRSAEPGGQTSRPWAESRTAPSVAGVQDPASEQVDNLLAIQVVDRAVVTSGSYQRCFQQDGQTYWHILDPETASSGPHRSGVGHSGGAGLVRCATAWLPPCSCWARRAGIQTLARPFELGVQVIWVRE